MNAGDYIELLRLERDAARAQAHARALELEEARSEVEKLRALAIRLTEREEALPQDLRDAQDELERLRERGQELLDEGLVFFYGHERMADVARRQREACANYLHVWRYDPSKGARSWDECDAVRATPLVTDEEKP